MLRDALFIGLHDLKLMLKQKETLLWTFLMPPIFFGFIGWVTAGFGPGGHGSDKVAVRVGDDAGFLADEVLRRLEEQGFELRRPDDDPEAETRFEEYTRRLEIPSGFTAGVLAGEQQEVLFRRRESGLSTDLDKFRLGRAVYTVLADVVAATSTGVAGNPTFQELTPADLERLHATPRALKLDVSRAGNRVEIPSGYEQAVPGTMVMFTMIILLTSGATVLLAERKEGLLRRLASAPVRRGAVVGGKWFGKLSLAGIQVAYAMVIGSLVFRVDWGPNLPMLCLVLLAYASFLTSLAILLGNYAKSEGQAVGLGVGAGNVFAALGGCWWPIEITPDFMQKLALFLPTGWMMDAMHKLVSFGASPATTLPHVLGMSFGALLLGQICARKFRFE